MRRQVLLALAVGTSLSSAASMADVPKAGFGPSNPFYEASALPFHAPPFDKIKDTDYEPAIEAGMAEQMREVEVIVQNPAAPTFDNTFAALEKSGRLLDRANQVFEGVTGANTNPKLQEIKTELAPKLAAHSDAILLNSKLFERVSAVYEKRESSGLDAEQKRLVEYTYDEFVHAGAKLSNADKERLKKMNTEESRLSDSFLKKLLAANTAGGYLAPAPEPLAGLSDAQLAGAVQDAQARHEKGYLVPLQNTTQQPVLDSLKERTTRNTIFDNSWNRTERGDANDTRSIVLRLAHLRAERAQLLGFPNHAAWQLEDQMAKTPQAALDFMKTLVPLATARATREGKDIQAVIDAQHGGFQLEAWDWDFYAEQVRKAKYDLNDDEVKPYF
jgi:peptidyl-dipeptidase Dcp